MCLRRPSVHGCLKGVAGLTSSDQGPPASKLLCPVVKALLNARITTLAQADRMLALTILLQALQVRFKTLMAAYMQ